MAAGLRRLASAGRQHVANLRGAVKLQAGDQAPDFRLDGIAAADGTIRPVALTDSAGTIRLLNVVNSVDTPVCDLETRHWEDLARDLPPGAQIYTVSMDLPFAMGRWQQAAGVGPWGSKTLIRHAAIPWYS
jgi:peroxiredoxin